MNLTKVERRQLRIIIRKLIIGDKRWLSKQEITWGGKSGYWILNYLPGDRNPYNSLCRGLVVQIPRNKFDYLLSYVNPLKLIKSFPFTRFYNYGEPYINAHGKKQIARLNFSESEMIEKLDGTMVGVFFPHKNLQPEWHTRRMISLHAPDKKMVIRSFHSGLQSQVQIMKLIGEHVKTLQFTKSDIDMTYVFEFIHESTRVLTQYESSWNGLWLIGARNLRTYKEIIDQEELNKIANRLGCRRPQLFHVRHDNLNEITAIMEQRAKDIKDFEGCVFIDRKGHRVKIKREQYVVLHHMLGEVSYKHLIPRILHGEEEEIAAYFPHVIPLIQTFKQAYKNYWSKVAERVMFWRQQNLDRKSLALLIFKERKEQDSFIQSQIMKLYSQEDNSIIWKEIDAALRNIALGSNKQEGSPKKLMEIIELTETETE